MLYTLAGYRKPLSTWTSQAYIKLESAITLTCNMTLKIKM